MRDALYRICEAYYNGQLSRADVKLLITRSQDLTAAVVSIEQLTGAVVAQQAALGGGAASSASAAMLANAEALAQARALEKKYDEELKAAIAARDARRTEQSDFERDFQTRYNAATPEGKEKLQAERATKQAKLDEAENLVKLKQQQFDDIKKTREAIEMHQDSSIASASASTTSTALLSGGSVVKTLDKDTAQAIATAVAAITTAQIRKSYVVDQCVSLLTFPDGLAADLRSTCLEVVKLSALASARNDAAGRDQALELLDSLQPQNTQRSGNP
jgi:hypothetical protein